MTIDTEKINSQTSSEYLQGQAISKQKENNLIDALSLYLKSIELNELQPEWIYSNAITLAAQINRFDIGDRLQGKALRFYANNDEVNRAIALLHESQSKSKEAIYFYQKATNINASQPEWVYLKLYNLLLAEGSIDRAELVQQQGLNYFPESTILGSQSTEKPRNYLANKAISLPQKDIFRSTETPQNIEHNVELNLAETRRQLMDESIIKQYEILLEQLIFKGDRNLGAIDNRALLHCLAEIKTDIHYLKTQAFNPPAEMVDPQAKEKVNIEKIVTAIAPIPIQCQLKNRIVGSGWHNSEERGRWTGDSTISSLVLPYPTQGKYRLEIVVRDEAKIGLLNTLKISICDRPISIASNLSNSTFPVVITEEIEIVEQNQSFLNIDLIVAETIRERDTDSRLIGLLVEQISLIPLFQ